MSQTQSPPRLYTVEEYQALEEASEQRHEYFEGEVFAMSGASATHHTIRQNCVISLRTSLRGRGCKVYDEGMQLAVAEGRYYTYPDVMVTCHPEDVNEERIMRHPVLIIEILSPSTADHDRSWKFNQYKQLPSLQHYVLVSQHTCLVEWFRREPSGVWSFTPLGELTDTLEIPELAISLRVADVYDEISITPMRAQPPGEL
ncbi:Endonuclease, Uma2 family (restriction endonuclease fold) [Hymenobacter daecheongensis DSM 21074]|uniref:Endonuclease, Uma2 family (Restriction endonuclease fold) n=1 Tax=Hymenobacter daecheongensis DSM 21074 TaxID=1121955 RepID=A0A1M6H1R8_9BACT|nr:Uma2 family endonuclease [Hymenobacter daecheongensis]SHJ16173.1 Endonuclease, Uma2 family (restriction endonuclease fold) [Hymenobacter daecheongensis DSM 21074]